MVKKFLSVVLSFAFLVFSSLLPFAVGAESEEGLKMVQLSEEDYAAYIQEQLDRPVTYAVDLTKPSGVTYESTNTPKKSGAGSISSPITSAVIDYGIEIIKDVINDSVIENTSSGLQIPDFRQQMGKCRIVYSSGLVEILTCSLTIYSTQVIGTLGEPTGAYKPHAILTFIRESSNRYTVTTICDNDAKKYCDSYSTTGVLSFSSYVPYSTTYPVRFFDYKSQETVSSPRPTMLGQRYDGLTFRDFGSTDELTSSIFSINYLFFGTASMQGLPEINSGYQYKPLSSLVSTNTMAMSVTGSASLSGFCLAVTNSITNSYQDYIQMTDINDTPDREQKQSITYLSELNTTNIYNDNTIKNYDFLSLVDGRITTNSNFSGWWQNNVSETVDNSVHNTYNYYWSQEPSPTEPPTDPPTEPLTDLSTSSTSTTETFPLATLPTGTFPPAVLPKYTLDITVLESGADFLYDEAENVDVSRGFWLIRLMQYVLKETGLFSYFIFAFLLGLVGVLLWR